MVARLREMILASERVFADETVVPVLDPGRGRTKQGYFWAVARDDRPWGGRDPSAVVYTYAPGRGHHYAQALLGDYRGILQCDGYRAYKQLALPTGNASSVTLAFCWSRSHPLCDEPLGWSQAVLGRWPHRTRHQQHRARHEAHLSVEEK